MLQLKEVQCNTLGLTDALGQAKAFITFDLGQQVPGYLAGTTLTWQDNGAAAQLNLLAGSTVLYAELQWGGVFTNGTQDVSAFIDDAITFNTPSGSFSLVSDAATLVEFGGCYSRSVEVTNLIENGGDGTYSVEGVPATILGLNNTVGWTLGVIYENQLLPIQNMSIYSGIQYINGPLSPIDFTLDGFITKSSGTVQGRVLISDMEGDPGGTGDQILIGPNTGSLVNLSGPNNAVNNFFQSNINNGDSESPNVGQIDTSGTFGNLNQPTLPARYGWDITNVSSNNFMNNQTSAVVRLTSVGDGLSVPLMGIQLDAVFIDYGDAPDTSAGNGPNDYSTLFANNGPSHGIVNELYLGTQVTGEDDAYQNSSATGDDIIENIQDDGVIIPVVFSEGTNIYSVDLSYTNNTGSNANIYAWIDFNRDGIFQLEEAAQPLGVASSISNPRVEELTFNILAGSSFTPGDTTFIRVRITTDELNNSNLLPTQEDTRSLGPASDGEVEDYQVDIIELNVEGTIWYDLNCDGLRDISEPLAEGITVELYGSDNDAVPFAIDTTDINGFYTFPNLPYGNYYVKVILPNGYEYTLTNVGANDNIDSDVDKTNGESPTFTLDGNNQLEIVDAGLCKLNKISGQAFYDCDGNEILDFGEPYLCGVQVTLLDVNGFEIGTVITDCNGYYEFLNLPPGDYTVRVVAPPDMNYVLPVPGDFYGSKPDDITGEFGVTLTNEDYIQGFAGFKGNSTLDARYCTECEVCSEKNKYKSCRFGCNIYTNENSMIVCGENSNCSCESNCNCKNCNGTCVGCNTCKSNRTFNHNRVSCSQCDNSNNCTNCDDKKQDDNGCGCY